MVIVNVFYYWFKLIKFNNILNNDVIFIVMVIDWLWIKIILNCELKNDIIKGILYFEWKL